MQLAHGTYSAADLATAVGGRQVAGAPATRLGRVSIDSRSLAPGDLFFAIVAARDGHDFVPAAIAGGAAGVVVQQPVTVPAGEAVVVAGRDTPTALQAPGGEELHMLGVVPEALHVLAPAQVAQPKPRLPRHRHHQPLSLIHI